MLEEIINQFNINGNLIKLEENHSGIINNTYVGIFKMNDGSQKKYLIQKINEKVFLEPYKVMANIEGVTNFLKEQESKEENHKHKITEIVKTKDGSCLYATTNDKNMKEYYRIYEYIDNAISYDCSTDANIVYNVGKAFGNFQRLLVNYPIQQLEETIKDFHNTEKRLAKFIEDIKLDSNNRVSEVYNEIEFILKRAFVCSEITSKLGTTEIPYRVTHNDTKVNNVLINQETGEYVSVIDLDTVMPGSVLFDYGDGIRSTAASSKEDETDLSKIFLRLDLFQYYTDGFLSEMAPYLTKTEVSLMGESIRVITLELAMRFLNDYINGDTYFKTDYKEHNLVRARTQIKLVKDIEEKLDYINDYISKSYEKNCSHITKKYHF